MHKFNNVKALALGQGITFVASFMMLPYLSRALPIEVYGSYGQVIFYISIFISIALVGLNKVIFIYLSKDVKKETTYINNLFACCFMGVILAIICALSSPLVSILFDNSSITIPIIVFAITIPFETMFTCYSSILVNENKSSILAVTSVISSLLKYFLLFLVIQFTESFLLIFVCLLLASIIQLILIASLSKVPLHFKKISSLQWKEQIKMGIPLGLTSIIGKIYYITDGFIVSMLLSTEQYAILRNGGFQIPLISTLYSIIGLVLMRDISDFIQNEEKSKIVTLKARAITLAIIVIYPVTIFLIVFAKNWIPFLFSSLYQGSIIIFMIYNIMTLFRITDYENIIVLSEKGSSLPAIYLKSFLINIFLSVPLTYYLGPSGSAIATILSFLYLVTCLTKINLSYLNTPLSSLLNIKHIIQITSIILILALIPTVLEMIINMNNLGPWFLPTIVILLLALTYHFLFKSSYVNQKDKQSFFRLIPIPLIEKFCVNQYCK